MKNIGFISKAQSRLTRAVGDGAGGLADGLHEEGVGLALVAAARRLQLPHAAPEVVVRPRPDVPPVLGIFWLEVSRGRRDYMVAFCDSLCLVYAIIELTKHIKT